MATSWTDRAAVAGVVALALVLPLAASPFVSDSTFATRLLVAAIGIGVAFLVPSSSPLPGPVRWSLLATVVAFVAAALAGATPVLSLLGRYPRYEGLLTVLGYVGAVAAGARLLNRSRTRSRDLFSSAGALAALITAVTAGLQTVFYPDDRVTALLGNSSVLGTWAAILCCLLGWQLVTERRALWVAGFFASLLTVVLSASRAAMLALAVAFIAAALLRPLTQRQPPWWAGLGLAGAVGLTAWLTPSAHARLVGATPFADATIDGRLQLWSESWQLVVSHPLLGVGPSRFVDAIGQFHTPSWAAAVGPYAPPDSPHNLALQMVSAAGFVGLAAIVAVAVATAVVLWRRRPWDTWTAGAVTAALTAGVSQLFSFTDPVTTTVVLCCLGGALAAPASDQAVGHESRGSRRALHGASADRRAITVAVVGCGWAVAAALNAGSVLLAEARFSAMLTDPALSTPALLTAADVRPGDPDLTRRIGYAVARLAEQGRVEAAPAVPAVTAACRALVSSTECLHTLGDLQALAGDPAASITTLTEALDLDPTNVDTFLKRGVAHAEAGDAEAAERDFTRAVALRPSAAEPWDDLALLYQREGRTVDAERARARADQLRR
ncbi:MAG: O-antigen ligase family protein [Propionicimonas sp.]|nr:O-antigen ligase family protein [Propionicimonas sp.]